MNECFVFSGGVLNLCALFFEILYGNFFERVTTIHNIEDTPYN